MATAQLTLNFERGLAESFATCREYVAHRIHHQGRAQKAIAADMDYSPSDLTRKLAQSPSDTRRFNLDDLERYMDVTGDTQPVIYLVEKYLEKEDPRELQRRIEELQKQLDRATS